MTSFGDHKAPVRNGLDSHRLLHQAIEELPAVTGQPSVEPERELIEVVIEMLPRHTAVVDAQEPPFQQGRARCTRGSRVEAVRPLPLMTRGR